MLYVTERCYESGGRVWDQVFNNVCWCLFICIFFTGTSATHPEYPASRRYQIHHSKVSRSLRNIMATHEQTQGWLSWVRYDGA